MKQVLEPLALIAGVRMVALISEDGVPIATTAGMSPKRSQGEADPAQPIDRDEELNSFTALAASWFSETTRAAGQLSWSRPGRMVLRATLGELVLQQAPGAVVLVVLERGVTAEELRVPIEGAIARLNRVLRTIGDQRSVPSPPVPSGRDGSHPGASELMTPPPPGYLAENHCSETSGDH